MGMTQNVKGDDEDVMLEVNMTPLIDVMLVLIIMFIITIPIQNNAININMPTPSPPTNQKLPEVVDIVVKPDGQVLWNNAVIANPTELEGKFNVIAHQADQDQVHIKPDAQANYKDVAMVMAMAQRVGVKKMGILNSG